MIFFLFSFVATRKEETFCPEDSWQRHKSKHGGEFTRCTRNNKRVLKDVSTCFIMAFCTCYKAFHESEHVNRRRGNGCPHPTLDASRLPDLMSHSSSFNNHMPKNKAERSWLLQLLLWPFILRKNLSSDVSTSAKNTDMCQKLYKIHSFL